MPIKADSRIPENAYQGRFHTKSSGTLAGPKPFMQAAHDAPAGHQRAHQSRPTATGGRPIYTRQQITDFYKQRRDGHISDADWARREADIVAAGREGRIAGALNLVDGTELSRLR
jgi:hypothetical protein